MNMAEEIKQSEIATEENNGAPVAEPPPSPAAEDARKNPNMRWYIVHSYSGFERNVKESI